MGLFVASALGATPSIAPPADDRDALAQLWTGIYDMTEERVASSRRILRSNLNRPACRSTCGA